jgi:hypothetical protein
VLTEEEQALAEEELKRKEAETEAMLDSLGVSLASSRSKAMQDREASGIELEWEEDEEHYEGIDDANRGERKSWRGKPPGQADVPAGNLPATTSTVFINITRPYVDAASARVADMLLPTDDRAWGIKPTPMPELANMAEGKFPPAIVRQAADQFPGQPEMARSKLHQAVEAAVEQMAVAKGKAEMAQKQIEDWHVECQYHAEVRLMLEDATKLGTGILKGPTPMKQAAVAFVDGKLVVQNEIQPASIRINPWNFYPDGACAENVHSGSFCWERDDISEKALYELIGQPGYIESQIQKVLVEGAMRATRIAPDRPTPEGHTPDKSGMFEIWYFTGSLKREDLEAIGCQCPEDEHVSVPAQITMVNNRIIKSALNVLDTGDLPYDVMVWQKRSGHWAGVGVSRQIRTPQEIVTGAGRILMDNAGRAGGPQLVVQGGIIVPQDGVYEVTPWKVWIAGEDADVEHLDKAFRFVTIPMLEAELQNIIRLGLKLAEDVTGLPLLLQGQQGSAPDTLGGLQMMNNNASAVLRRIARLFDDRVTEPHIRRYYNYLLMYGEDEMKGDFQVDARGSSALVQRDLENQAIGEMVKMVGNPVFGIDPKKWAAEWLKSKHLDPKRFEFDDEKWQEVVANMAKGATDPRLAVAQLRSDTDAKLMQMEQAFEADQNSRDRELELMVKSLDAELAKAGLTGDQEKVLKQIKGRLGETVLKLRAQREMQFAEHGNARTVEALKPPTEPRGRAPAGKAFIQ